MADDLPEPAMPGLAVLPAAVLTGITPDDPKTVGNGTARKAIGMLLATDPRYRLPTGKERQALLVGFARRGKTLIGNGYDVVRVDGELDLTDDTAIAEAFDRITICEIKSSNRNDLKSGFGGYLFNITGAEQQTAQCLGSQYRIVFVNTVTGEHQEMSFTEVLGRAKAFYPAWHIRL